MAVIWVFAVLLAFFSALGAARGEIPEVTPMVQGSESLVTLKFDRSEPIAQPASLQITYPIRSASFDQFGPCVYEGSGDTFAISYSEDVDVAVVTISPGARAIPQQLDVKCRVVQPFLSTYDIEVKWGNLPTTTHSVALKSALFTPDVEALRYSTNTIVYDDSQPLPTVRFSGWLDIGFNVTGDLSFFLAGSKCMEDDANFESSPPCSLQTKDGTRVLSFVPDQSAGSTLLNNLQALRFITSDDVSGFLEAPRTYLDVVCPAFWLPCLVDEEVEEPYELEIRIQIDSDLVDSSFITSIEGLVKEDAEFEIDGEIKDLADTSVPLKFSFTEDDSAHLRSSVPLTAFLSLTNNKDSFLPPQLVSLDHMGAIRPAASGQFSTNLALGLGNAVSVPKLTHSHLCVSGVNVFPRGAIKSDTLAAAPAYSVVNPGPHGGTTADGSTYCEAYKDAFEEEDAIPFKHQAQGLVGGKGITLSQHASSPQVDASSTLAFAEGTFPTPAPTAPAGERSDPYYPAASLGHTRPRPRPRTFHAVAASFPISAEGTADGNSAGNAAAGSTDGTEANTSAIDDYVTSGQLVFWFGGSPLHATGGSRGMYRAVLGDLWVHDVVADTWTLLYGGNEQLNRDPTSSEDATVITDDALLGTVSSPDAPAARVGAALAYDAEEQLVWLYGGSDSPVQYFESKDIDEKAKFFNDLWSFDLRNRVWRHRHGQRAPFSFGDVMPAETDLPAVVGAAMLVRPQDKGVYIVGGLALRHHDHKKTALTGALVPLNCVHRFNRATAAVALLSGASYSTSSVVPKLSDEDAQSQLPPTGFHSIAWDPVPAGGSAQPGFYVFGGVQPVNLDRASSVHNSAYPSSDSAVLGSLYRYTFGASSSDDDAWHRVWPPADPAAPALNLPGFRGVPRVVDSEGPLSNQPGGRVLAAMTVGNDGNLYLYGGRGHALGVKSPAEGAEGSVVTDALTAPFSTHAMVKQAWKGRDLRCYGGLCPTATHVFVVDKDSLQRAGLVKGSILRDMDVLLKASGSWEHLDVTVSRVDTWISLHNDASAFVAAGDVDALFKAAAAVPVEQDEEHDTALPQLAEWQSGEYLSFSPRDRARTSDSPSPRNAVLWDGASGIIVTMRIQYNGFPTSNDTPFSASAFRHSTATAPAADGVALMSGCRSAVRFSFTPIDAYADYFSTSTPEVILRSHLPPSLSAYPAGGSFPAAQPQLDDLWRFTPATGTWTILGGSHGTSVSDSQRGSNAAVRRATVGVDGHWPGARVSAALVAPRSRFAPAPTSDIFLVGGSASIRSADDDLGELEANYAPGRSSCRAYGCIGYTDTWSLEVGTGSCLQTTMPWSASCAAAYDAMLPAVPFLNAHDYGFLSSGPAPLGADACAHAPANPCGSDGGECVATNSHSQYRCKCPDYVPGAACAGKGEEEASARAHLELKTGRIYDAALPLFSAVAVHPSRDIIVAMGGIVTGEDGERILMNEEHVFVDYNAPVTAKFADDTVTLEADGEGVWGVDNHINPSESHGLWFTKNGEALCVLAPSPLCGMAVWCKDGNDAATPGGFTLVGPTAAALNQSVADQKSVVTSATTFSADNIPAPRDGYASAAAGDDFCIYSGTSRPGARSWTTQHADVWCFSAKQEGWRYYQRNDIGIDKDINSEEPIPPVHGLLGRFGSSFTPGSRHGAAMAASADGEYLYLFGGVNLSEAPLDGKPALMNDLWVFSRARRQWAFLGGSTTYAAATSPHAKDRTMGSLGSFSRLNVPAARVHATAAVSNGFLFIGYGVTRDATAESDPALVFSVHVSSLHTADATNLPVWASLPGGNPYGKEPAWAVSSFAEGSSVGMRVFGAADKASKPLFGARFFTFPVPFSQRESAESSKTALGRIAGTHFSPTQLTVQDSYPYYSLTVDATAAAPASPSSLIMAQSACAGNPCSAPGTEKCSASPFAGLTAEFYTCTCKSGYSGLHCERDTPATTETNCAAGSAFDPASKKCVCGSDSGVGAEVCAPTFHALEGTSAESDYNAATTTAPAVGSHAAAFLGADERDTVIFSSGGLRWGSDNAVSGPGGITAFNVHKRKVVTVLDEPSGDALQEPDYDNGVIGSRFGHSMAFDAPSGSLLIFGGYAYIAGEFRLTEDLWRITFAGNTTTVTSLSSSARSGKSLATEVVDGTLTTMAATKHQSAIPGTVTGYPGSRAFHSSVVLRVAGTASLVVFGGIGKGTDGEGGVLSSMWHIPVSAAPGDAWVYGACSTMANFEGIATAVRVNTPFERGCPAARSRAAFVATAARAYIVGGLTSRGAANDAWSLDFNGGAWVHLGGIANDAELSLSRTVTQGSASVFEMGSTIDVSCAPAPQVADGIVCYGGTQAVTPAAFANRGWEPTPMTLVRPQKPELRFPLQLQGFGGVVTKMTTVITAATLAASGVKTNADFMQIGFRLWGSETTLADVAGMTVQLTVIPPEASNIIEQLIGKILDFFTYLFSIQPTDGVVLTDPTLTADGYAVFAITDSNKIKDRVTQGIVATVSDVRSTSGFRSLSYVQTADSNEFVPTSKTDTSGLRDGYLTLLYNSDGTIALQSPYSPSLAFSSTFGVTTGAALHPATSTARLFAVSSTVSFLAGAPSGRPDLAQAAQTLAFDSTAPAPPAAPAMAAHYRGFDVGTGATKTVLDSDGTPLTLRNVGAPPLSRAGFAVVSSSNSSDAANVYVLYGGAYESRDVRSHVDGTSFAEENIFTTYLPSTLARPVLVNRHPRYGGPDLAGSGSSVPTPSVTSVAFESTTAAIRVVFSMATTQPQVTVHASRDNCNHLVQLAPAGALGTGARCQWINAQVFRIVLGRGFKARVGSMLTVLDDRVAAAEFASFDSFMVAITVPVTGQFAAPVAVVQSPAEAGACEIVTFSGLASYRSVGLAFAYEWEMVSGNSAEEVAKVNAYFKALSPYDAGIPFTETTSPRFLPRVTLKMSLLDAVPGPRSFKLTVTAWHGGSNSMIVAVAVQEGSVPTISIAGSKFITAPANRNLLVNAEIAPAPQCGDLPPLDQQTLSYTWELISAPAGVDVSDVSYEGSFTSLRLRAFALKPSDSTPYQFRVTVVSALASGGTRSSSDVVSITVPTESLRAVIRGGSSTHSLSLPLLLDGSESWNPAVDPSETDPRDGLVYAWKCVPAAPGGQCISAAEALMVDWTASQLELSPAALASMAALAGSSKTVRISLKVSTSGGSDDRMDSIETTVKLVDVDYSLSIITPTDPMRLDPVSPVTVTAVAVMSDPPADIVDLPPPGIAWVIDSKNFRLSTSGALLPSAAPAMTLVDAQSGTYTASLRLPPGSIEPGIELGLRASLFETAAAAPDAIDPSSGFPVDLEAGPQSGELLSATTSLQVNAPPMGGECYPQFPNGASSDEAVGGVPFLLVCSNWDDADGHTPLRYQWLVRSRRVRQNEIDEMLVEIGIPLPSPVLETVLEPGLEDDGYERRVLVVITDTLGAETTVEVAIPFAAPAGSKTAPAEPVIDATLSSSGGSVDTDTASAAGAHVTFSAQSLPDGSVAFTTRPAQLRALPTVPRVPRPLAAHARPAFAVVTADAAVLSSSGDSNSDSGFSTAASAIATLARTTEETKAAEARDRVDLLFRDLTSARAKNEIRSVMQVSLRISDALEDLSSGLTAADEAMYRAKLISAITETSNLLTLSQDARRVAAASDAAAARAAPVESGDSFLSLAGNSEAAVELLTLSCGDASLLGPAERTTSMRFTLEQMARLAAYDKTLGVAPRTADTAAGLMGSVVASFAEALAQINPNATLPAPGEEPNADEGQVDFAAAVAEAKKSCNMLSAHINVAEVARARRQMVGSPVVPLSRNGITTLSLPVSVEDVPATVTVPARGVAAPGAAVAVALPQWALRALGPRELQLVLGVVDTPDVMLVAGMGEDGHLNATRSSSLVSLTVFSRDTTTIVPDVPVSAGVTVPLPASEVFNLPPEALELADPFSTMDIRVGGASVGGSGSGLVPLAGWGAARPLSASALDAAAGSGSNDTQAFEFTIPHDAPTWHNVTFSCEWWSPADDGNGGSWSTEGCAHVSTSADNTTTVCRCVHLTMFRVRMSLNDMIPRFNTLKPSDFLNLTVANIREHPVPLIVVLVWFGVYVIFFFLGAWIDKRKDARALRKYHAEWRPTAEAAAATLAAAKALRDEDRRVGFYRRWWLQLKYSIRHDHMWLSVFLRDDTNAFSSTGRVTAAFVLILTGYMINAIFFGTIMGFGTIIKSLCAAIIILPVGMFMIVLFHHTQQGRIKDALYAYAEHLAFLKWTGRDADPEYAGKMEHQFRANPDIPSENVVPMLASIATSAGWHVGPNGAHVSAEHRGTRDQLALRGKLRLLVHVDYDFLLVWYQHWTWRNSFPRGVRLLGYVLLWIWILACVMLILVYGMQFDLVEGSSTTAWLQSSAISNALEIFIFKPLFVPFRVFLCLGLAALCCAPAPCLPTRTSRDDALTVFESWEIHSDATGTCKTIVGDGGVGLQLDVGNDEEDEMAMAAANKAAEARYNSSQQQQQQQQRQKQYHQQDQELVLVAAPGVPMVSSSSSSALASTPAMPAPAMPAPMPMTGSYPPPPAPRSASAGAAGVGAAGAGAGAGTGFAGVSSSGTPLPNPPGPRRLPPLLNSGSGSGNGSGYRGDEMELAPINLSATLSASASASASGPLAGAETGYATSSPSPVEEEDYGVELGLGEHAGGFDD